MLALIVPFLISNWRMVGVVVIGAGILAAGLTYRHALIVEGEQKALQKVEDANAQSNAAAAKAAKTVDDCFNAGGTWDRDSGVCSPAAGH